MLLRLPTRSSLQVALLILAAIALLALAWRTYEHNRAAASFFSNALQSEQISADVVVRGIPYRLERGEVRATDGAPVAGVRALPALRLAYAHATARRSPLLALPGVDPDELERAVAELDASQQRVIAMQATSSDALLHRSLYPITFLATLPALERARQQFIASGSDADLRRYEKRQRASIEAQSRDIRAFDDSLRKIITEQFSIITFGGIITSGAFRPGAANVEQRIREVRAQLTQRSRCFAGAYKLCDPTDIAIPTLPDSLSSSALSQNAMAQALDIKSLIETASGVPTPQMLVLSSSVCLAALPGPYAFMDTAKNARATLGFINDLFFQPITGHTEKNPYLAYLADEYGMTLLKETPTAFYMCPTVGDDIGRIRVLEHIDAFATAHPGVAARERAVLRSSPYLREDYAIGYLRAALAETGTGSETQGRDELVELALMYLDRAAGLEDIISLIAFVNSYHVTITERGAPFNMLPQQMFLSHSAFPTLFLAHNRSAGTSTVAIQSPSATTREILLARYVSYSSLKDSRARDEFIRELRAYSESEGGYLDI